MPHTLSRLGALTAIAVVGLGTPALAGGKPTVGDDRILGDSRPNALVGFAGNDVVRGKGGRDRLAGGPGDDRVAGGPARDTVDGGTGNDRLSGDGGADRIGGHLGNDVISGGSGDDTADAFGGNDLVMGDDGRDTLNGSTGDDTVLGGAGDDNLPSTRRGIGRDGKPSPGGLLGGPGNDRILGEAGKDHVSGGDGDDVVDGGDADDELDGGPGVDVLIDGLGDDNVTGDEGDDVLFVGPGADRVFSEEGDDAVFLFADGQPDLVRCDDLDETDGPTSQGLNDRVVYIGVPDPLDTILASCDTVLQSSVLPAGWPYGPVSGARTRTAANAIPRTEVTRFRGGLARVPSTRPQCRSPREDVRGESLPVRRSTSAPRQPASKWLGPLEFELELLTSIALTCSGRVRPDVRQQRGGPDA